MSHSASNTSDGRAPSVEQVTTTDALVVFAGTQVRTEPDQLPSMTEPTERTKTTEDLCVCRTWCRTWEETLDGKYPLSNHAPGCPAYKQEEFTVLEYDGTRCVMEPHEAKAMIEESDEEYIVSTVMLTRDQFNKMPEFEGF